MQRRRSAWLVLLSALLACCAGVRVSFPTTPILDAFNRSNETPIAAPWLATGGWWATPANLTGNTLAPNGASGSYWPTPYGPNFEVYGTLAALADTTADVAVEFDLLVDPTDVSSDGYGLLASKQPGGYTISYYRWDAGVFAAIGSVAAVALSAGDGIGIRRIGGQWAVFVDSGSGWTQIAAFTDTTYDGPLSLVVGFDDTGGTPNQVRVDNVGGGTIGIFPVVNPPQGDPSGDVHFIRVKIGVENHFAADTLIRDDAGVWGGKKAATLLKASAFDRQLSREGYQASTGGFQVSDAPHPISGDRHWRGIMRGVSARTIEGALIEYFRCSAPNGRIVGQPFKLGAWVVKPGGFTATSGFLFDFSCVDLLGDRFANPLNQPQIPQYRFTSSDISVLKPDTDGKYAPRILGSCVELGVGVAPMLPIAEDVNLLGLLGGAALDVNVDIWMISEGANFNISRGYYNPTIWGADAEVFYGDLVRPTPENRNGHVFRASVAGTGGSSEPTWPTSGTVADGGVTWDEAGIDDPKRRYEIPASAYSDFLTHPFAPNWTSATGLTTQYLDYPALGRRFTPVFTLHDHRFGKALRERRITLLFDVIGAMVGPGSGPAITAFSYLYIRLLLDYSVAPTNLTTYSDVPTYNFLDGPYSIIDIDSADAAEAVGDLDGGLVAGFILAADGNQSGMWEILSKLLRGGRLEVGQDRHGRLMFARRNAVATATITFRAQRIIESSYHADGSKRATKIEYRYGKRYADPFSTTDAPAPGEPLPTPKSDWNWASGLQTYENVPAYDALWNTHAALLPPIKYDNEMTRDALTAAIVAQRELDYAVGESPAYHGTLLFDLTGPLPELLLRLDSNGKTRELNDVITIIDDEGPSADGTTSLRCRVTRIRTDAEADRVTLSGEVLGAFTPVEVLACGDITDSILSEDFESGSSLATLGFVQVANLTNQSGQGLGGSTWGARGTGTASQKYYAEAVHAVTHAGRGFKVEADFDHGDASNNGSGYSAFELRTNSTGNIVDNVSFLQLYHGVGAGSDRDKLKLFIVWEGGQVWESDPGIIIPGTTQRITMCGNLSSIVSGSSISHDGNVSVYVDGVLLVALTGMRIANEEAFGGASIKYVMIGAMGKFDNFEVYQEP